MKKVASARIMMIISMTVFGTIGIFVRNIPLSSSEIALYRASIASLLIGIYLLATKQKLDIKGLKKELILLFFSGMAMGFNWIFLFEAYNYTTVSVATLSYYFAPVIVIVMSPLLFREKMVVKGFICFIFSAIGVVLVTGVGSLSDGNHTKGIFFGLCAAALYATVILLNKFIKGVSGIHRTFLQFISAVAVLLPYVLMTDGIALSGLKGLGWANLLTVCIVHTGITYCLYFSSVKELSGEKAAILSYIDPLVAVILSVTVLEESMTVPQIVGGIMILGFTLANELPVERIFMRKK